LFTRDTINKLTITLLSLVFFVPFLGGVHLFDWDEINFAEIAREMIVTGDYLRPQINFEPFWEKPPLFIWMQVLSMKIFGINDFAARLPNAMCGLVSLFLLYSIGKRFRDEKMGMWWVLAYMGSILPHLYFRSGIIDPWFNLFIFLGLHFYLRYREISDKPALKFIAFSGIFIGLAVLTKGPVALLIFGLCGFFFGVLTRFRNWLKPSAIFVFVIAFIGTVGVWYGTEIAMNGTWFMNEFITYQIRLFQTKDAGHGGFPGYHFVVILFGCFPASAFVLRDIIVTRNIPREQHQKDFLTMMKVMFWVVLLLFSVVSTKIVHYSSLAYFPLTFIAALELYRLSEEKKKPSLITAIFLGINGFLFAVAAIAFPILLNNREVVVPLLKDPFAAASLMAEISTPWYLFAAGTWILIVIGISHFWVRKPDPEKGYQFFFLGNGISVAIVLYLFIGRVEMLSQNAHIEFLKKSAADKIPVQTMGFKSYAQYYYGRSSQYLPGWEEILEKGYPTDIHLVAKINREAEFDLRGDLEKIGHKNGFVFYLKKAADGTK
jgi:4-amino-4-deoxy-L-arabinose transferase-like glycosyltransferase